MLVGQSLRSISRQIMQLKQDFVRDMVLAKKKWPLINTTLLSTFGLKTMITRNNAGPFQSCIFRLKLLNLSQ